MTLSFLLDKIGVSPELDAEGISGVTDKIENVAKNCIFVCICGEHTDGHTNIASALQKGAVAVIGEETSDFDGYYRVPDSRLAFSVLCSAFHGEPSKKLRLIGITGTNGKTTTAEYTRFLLEKSGHKCGLIGTLGNVSDGERVKTGYTTPGGNGFYGALADMVKCGCEFCVAEISSQALSQKRADAVHFETGVFTNLGSEHLDYHKTQEAYLSAKGRLAELSGTMLINSDDAYAERYSALCKDNKIKYYSARNGLADFMANNIKYQKDRVSYVLVCSAGVASVGFKGIGEFSVYNSLAAAAVCINSGIPFATVVEHLNELPEIPGRAQMINAGNFNVCVDFAHTPEALSNILLAVKSVTSGGIITVFGCGGNRDFEKRPLMGRIAANMSKSVIITSDNPRAETPEEIAWQIKSGIKRKSDVFTELDREKAIRLALNKAHPGDTVLIAGKGHENVQIFANSENEFNDVECVKNILGI